MNIKLSLLMIAFSATTFFNKFACKKNVLVHHNNAEITGIDKSMRPCNGSDPCSCPGGYFMHIDGISDPHKSCSGCNSFKTLQLPAGFTLSDQAIYPVPVAITWIYDSLNCDSSRIHLLSIVRR